MTGFSRLRPVPPAARINVRRANGARTFLNLLPRVMPHDPFGEARRFLESFLPPAAPDPPPRGRGFSLPSRFCAFIIVVLRSFRWRPRLFARQAVGVSHCFHKQAALLSRRLNNAIRRGRIYASRPVLGCRVGATRCKVLACSDADSINRTLAHHVAIGIFARSASCDVPSVHDQHLSRSISQPH